MDFPSYVPVGAREYIRRTLEGDGGHWQGVNAFVREYRQRGDANEALAELEREQACIVRFARDVRMRDVYTELRRVFTADDQYGHFLRSAWAAHVDFAPFRRNVAKAKELAPRIAEGARELAAMLDQLAATGTMPPSELYSIRALLDATDNHEMQDHNLYMWRGVRDAITGTRKAPQSLHKSNRPLAAARGQVIVVDEEEAAEAERNNPNALIVVLRAFKPGQPNEADPKEEMRNMLGYAWGVAPDLSAALETVARIAAEWTPQAPGVVGAAIASRKSNPVTAYLRAFARLIGENLRLDLAGPVVAAMAGTANVVLNDPDMDVSADAVRMALTRARTIQE